MTDVCHRNGTSRRLAIGTGCRSRSSVDSWFRSPKFGRITPATHSGPARASTGSDGSLVSMMPRREALDYDDDLVWHYTDAQALVSIVSTGAMWASHVEALNDTSELKYGWTILANAWASIRAASCSAGADDRVVSLFDETLQDADRAASDLQGEVYVVSASANGDNLNQWQHYGNHGYALGLRRSIGLHAEVHTAGGTPSIANGHWQGVLYEPDRATTHAKRALTDAVRDLTPRITAVAKGDLFAHMDSRYAIQHRLSQAVALYKHPAFSAEDEHRVIFIDSLNSSHAPVKSRARAGRLLQYSRHVAPLPHHRGKTLTAFPYVACAAAPRRVLVEE